MRLAIRLFAIARQRAGTDEVFIDLEEGATVAGLKQAVAVQVPELAPMLGSMMVAVDGEYADEERTIGRRAEVALIPPVSGGDSVL